MLFLSNLSGYAASKLPQRTPSRMHKHLKFEHFKAKHGLSQNTIYCISQDSRGFLWLGTEEGLNRYDGYDLKIYEYRSNISTSLSYNVVRMIYEDRSGALWVGTGDGLNRFDRERETFRHFKNDPSSPHDSLSDNDVTSILEARDGVLWIGTKNGGLNKYNPDNDTFTHYESLPSDPQSLSQNKISCLYEDRDGVLWIGTKNGLNRFDRKKEVFKRYHYNGKYANEVRNHIKTICEDQSGILWIGTEGGGLCRLDRGNNCIVEYSGGKYNSRHPDSFSTDTIRSIIEDSQSGNLWIGTLGSGLIQLDPQTGAFIRYEEQSNIATSLSNNNVYSLYEDKAGLIWVGTEDGLNKLDKRKNEFYYWTAVPGEKNTLNHHFVWSIFKDSSGIVWIGTNTGLNRFDRESEAFRRYENKPGDLSSLSGGHVTSIYEDHAGVLWVGTQEGLNKYNRQRETFTRYRLSNDSIYSITEDHSGVLWIGTTDGLNRYDRKRKNLKYYKHGDSEEASLSNDQVVCIFEDSENVLWVGTREGGLNRFHRKTETFTHYKHTPSNLQSISSDSISSFCEDKKGNLWVGTYKGLNRFDRRKKRFSHYWKKDGLSSDTIYGILQDESGFLWISTVKGLSKFDPRKNTFKNYDARDGLQIDEFNGGAFFKAPDGEMFFGGTNGFNHFYPHRIIDNDHQPSIVFTDFQIFNKPPRKNQLRKSIIETKEIVLTHRDYVFSFEFAALDFSTPDKNRYEYKMDKVDRGWVEGDAARRFVTYTRLDPGTYTFRVRGSNNDGRWNEEGASIKIVITPPFTQTWWFRIILGITFVLAIFGGYRVRTRYLRNKLAEQERVQKILKQSRDEMEKARDLAEIRHAENEKLLTAISAIFIAVDSDGLIFQWNKPSEEFFRICEDDVVKKPFVQVCKPFIGKEKLDEIIEKGLNQEPGKSSAKMIEISVDLKTKGKGLKLLVCSVSPIMDRSGKKLGFLLIAEDVTNRKQEEMLRNLAKKLESLGQMASGIAHEIKTPLQYIGDNARFVGDSFRDVVNFYRLVIDSLPEIENSGKKEIAALIKERSEEYDLEYIMEEIPTASEQIIDGVSRVSGIIKAMTEFSHPGRGVKEKADINGLLKSTLVMVKNRIKKSAEIRLELAGELPPIACFPAELNQVFLNLLVNALDAIVETGKWGVIRISTTIEGNEAVISISDTGCGIPEENRDDIFNPFFTTKAVGKGTGQGLSLARNIIIERHKGKMDYTTKPGEGTTFYIRLPMEGEH